MKGMSDLPESHRTEKSLSVYSSIVSLLISFKTYVRISRAGGYKFCSPHTLGYIADEDNRDPVTAQLIGIFKLFNI